MVLVALAACSPRVPSASFAGARLAAVGWDEVSGVVLVSLDNPLWTEVPVEALRWRLDVDGRVVASGARDDLAPLPADGAATLAIPVDLAWRELGAALSDGTGLTAPWTFSAAVDLATPAGTVSLPISRTGTLPRVAPPRLDGVDVGVDGTALVLDLALDVPQLPGFALETLTWTLDLGGRPFGSGGLAFDAPTDGLRRRIHLATRWDPVAVAGGLWTAWERGELAVGADFAGAFATPVGAVPIHGRPTFSVRW